MLAYSVDKCEINSKPPGQARSLRSIRREHGKLASGLNIIVDKDQTQLTNHILRREEWQTSFTPAYKIVARANDAAESKTLEIDCQYNISENAC